MAIAFGIAGFAVALFVIVAAKLRLIPFFVYALFCVTIWKDWYYADKLRGDIIGIAILALTIVLCIVSLMRSIRG
jgi:hypothetical protein